MQVFKRRNVNVPNEEMDDVSSPLQEPAITSSSYGVSTLNVSVGGHLVDMEVADLNGTVLGDLWCNT